MKGLAPLFLGIFGTFAFSWLGLTVIPNWQIGHLNPQSDEEGTDIYPQPQSGMFERGAHVYAANGCIYCHSQQVRADYAAADIERKWGNRRSAPRDYIFEQPVFLGKMRMGQDIANIGARESFSCSTGWLACASHFSYSTRRIASSVSKFARTKATNKSCSCGSSYNCISHSSCGECKSGRVTNPGSRSAMASSNRWRAADVLRCLASCASLFAAQHQCRFEHAVLSFSL